MTHTAAKVDHDGMTATREGQRNLTVRLEENIHRRLRILCADLDVSMQEILAATVASVLAKYEAGHGEHLLDELGID